MSPKSIQLAIDEEDCRRSDYSPVTSALIKKGYTNSYINIGTGTVYVNVTTKNPNGTKTLLLPPELNTAVKAWWNLADGDSITKIVLPLGQKWKLFTLTEVPREHDAQAEISKLRNVHNQKINKFVHESHKAETHPDEYRVLNGKLTQELNEVKALNEAYKAKIREFEEPELSDSNDFENSMIMEVTPEIEEMAKSSGIFEDEVVESSIDDEQFTRIKNKLSRIDNEISYLLKTVEILGHKIESQRRENFDIYSALDRRLNILNAMLLTFIGFIWMIQIILIM